MANSSDHRCTVCGQKGCGPAQHPGATEKRCTGCQQVKPMGEYRLKGDGRRVARCRDCCNAEKQPHAPRRGPRICSVCGVRGCSAEEHPDATHQTCNSCGKSLPFSEFYFSRGIQRYSRKCKRCTSRNPEEYRQLGKRRDVVKCMAVFRAKIYGAHRRARRAGLKCDLTEEMLMELLMRQQWCCAYSGRKMSFSGDRRFSFSVERKDPAEGYVASNVVLVCTWVNTMKLHHSYSEFLDLCRDVVRHHDFKAALPWNN